MTAHDHHTIHRQHIHHGWNNEFPPRLKIAPGETVHFETVDASSGQLSRSSTAADLVTLDLARVNPVTGPVYIDGAQPGDALKVTVLSFRPSGWGWTGNIPGFGLLADQFPDAHLHHWHYDPGLKPAMYGPGGRVPLKPMCGTIGVALAEAAACTASSRRATWAATWTCATSPKAPSSTCRSKFPARCSRWATRMRPKAMARFAARRSKPRSTSASRSS